MTRKELAEQIYVEKKRIGANITSIGRKTPLSKQEFVHRYLNGVGGTKGFKKEELESLLESMKKYPTSKTKSTSQSTKGVKTVIKSNKEKQHVQKKTGNRVKNTTTRKTATTKRRSKK